MYESNGITLNSSEFEELERLVGCEDPESYARSRLNPTGEKYAFDQEAAQVYLSLHEKGLVSGVKVWNGYLLKGVTVAGRAFVKDCRESAADIESREKADRRHDYAVAAFGILLGIAAEHFIGIAEAISSLLAGIL